MLRAGTIINYRYEIIEMVGSGGMADVYKAKDQKLNRFVAIKILKSDFSSDRSFVNKFRVEAQSAAGLSHPNIVNVYDVGEDSGLHYIVMELVEGITLKRFIEKKGRLEVKETVVVAIQIAQGMEAAHNNHIIHRDIKPQNIIISREGKVKVTDFGIAKATNSNTVTSNAMGSVHYLSPEQARGGYSDEKSDIYSLGVTIYEMLCGKVPFAGDNNVSIALLHIQGEATPLRSLDPSIPVSIDKIVQKCMQKKPERRYHSTSELIADLKKAIANPDGNYVQIPAFVSSDSPTINLSDDIGKIRNGYRDDPKYDTKYNTKHNPKYNTTNNDQLYNTRNTSSFDTRSNPMYATRNNQNNDMPEEEEELDAVDSKIDKFVLAGTIITFVILFVAVIFIVALFVFPKKKPGSDEKKPTAAPSPSVTVSVSPTPSEETFMMPDVLNQTEENAKAMIKEKNMNAAVHIKQGYSDQYSEGVVMEQKPEADTENPLSAQIELVISQGSEAEKLPNVIGLLWRDAQDDLEDNYGLIVNLQYEYHDTIKPGKVTRIEPGVGTPVKKGDKVTLYASKGKEISEVPVPSLIGQTKDKAIELLRKYKLEVGEVKNEVSDLQKGTVTFQSETFGTMVEEGKKINITISTGPETTYTYIGEVTVDTSPFEYEYSDYDSVEVRLEMTQDGKKSDIYNATVTSGDFPLTPPEFEGTSASPATVVMYVNGTEFRPEGNKATWTATFTQQEN